MLHDICILANFCRPHLYTQVDGSNDYINAIFVPVSIPIVTV